MKWPTARRFFYWRLRRLLAQQREVKDIERSQKFGNLSLDDKSAADLLQAWFCEENPQQVFVIRFLSNQRLVTFTVYKTYSCVMFGATRFGLKYMQFTVNICSRKGCLRNLY